MPQSVVMTPPQEEGVLLLGRCLFVPSLSNIRKGCWCSISPGKWIQGKERGRKGLELGMREGRIRHRRWDLAEASTP